MRKILGLFSFALAFVACTKSESPQSTLYLERTDWAPDVKTAVNSFIDLYKGTGSYAVFDFDNTCSIFDVEEQLIIHQLETMSFAMNPTELKNAISTGLDQAPAKASDWVEDISIAYDSLYGKYGPFTPKGLDSNTLTIIQKDSMWWEFAAKMGCLYNNVSDWVTADVSYNWVLYWFSGMTDNEIYDLAKKSHEKYSKVTAGKESWKSPTNMKSLVGNVNFEWTCGVQVTENIKELWRVLDAAGIDVWVCSASGMPQIMAAVDAFGLHDYCTGVLAMTLKHDASNKNIPEFDYTDGVASLCKGEWRKGELPTKAQTAGPGKVTAITNAIAPLYGGKGPVAGFMDSSGDFNFCTEFKSLGMVICFNRANRMVTDGGGLIAETAIYQRDNLGLDMQKAYDSGETLYLLQGRDENGLRTFRPSNKTIRLGDCQEKLFANESNEAQLEYIRKHGMTTKEILERFSIRTSAEKSELGFKYGWLDTYNGYHSR